MELDVKLISLNVFIEGHAALFTRRAILHVLHSWAFPERQDTTLLIRELLLITKKLILKKKPASFEVFPFLLIKS